MWGTQCEGTWEGIAALELSGDDIRLASFDELTAGGVDAEQVRSFLVRVASRVEALEVKAAESEEMRVNATKLLEQAEALVDHVTATAGSAAAGVLDADRSALELIAAAESRARAIEAAAEVQLRRAEETVAAALERGDADAAMIVANGRREALALIEAAEAKAAAPLLADFTAHAQQLADLREVAERRVELARVEAAAIEAEARDEAERMLVDAATRVDQEAARSEVGRIISEAEALLEEARVNAERIVMGATAQAEDLRSRQDLSIEVRRSVAAIRAVTDARAGETSADALAGVRSRAVQMLAELRRTDTRLAPNARADLLDQLFEVQDIVKRIEARLIGHDPADGAAERVVLDLTDRAEPDDSGSAPVRPSRYQQRSANLPKIGSNIADVNRAVRSIREHLHDRDLRDRGDRN